MLMGGKAAICLFLLLFFSLQFHKIHSVELDTISESRFLTDGDTLVSETGIFELGFFQPGSSKNRYLGIWYKQIVVKTVVWVANRDHPLPNATSNMLKISSPGILVLSNNNTMIWSSNTTKTTSSRNVTSKLHDNGNLVLLDQHENVLWQSFDYPTDTLLPGMKLGKNLVTGLEWHLWSWKNNQDPSTGEITWGADTRVYPENKMKQGERIRFRGGPWNNQKFTGISQFNRSLTFTYVVSINKNEISFSYNLDISSIISRVVLNSSGQLESTVWVEDGKKWQLSLTLPRDICDTYNICSAYGSCSVDTVTQSCACLDEKRFVPRNEKSWNSADWSGGCVRRTPLDCKNGSEGFIKYSDVKLPDTESSWFNMSMSLDECELKCLKNCTCMAYANPDPSLAPMGCLLWFEDLKDIRVYPQGSGGQDIYVRMASSELVAQSNFKKSRGAQIKIILPSVLTGILLIGVISTWLWYARRKRTQAKLMGEGGSLTHVSESHEEDLQLPLYSFSTIAIATSKFSTENILGEGGFGTVYKGVLEDGLEIAVKRLSKTSNQGVDEFKNEVICISKLQHRNLVKLLGCCIQGDERLLIYEYMRNKSLDSLIFDKTQSRVLDWTKRFNIIKGIAKGLLYLHHDSRLRIIHRDLKASNILLDQDMNPKISDFGIARSFGGNETEANTHRVVGTYGYMSPEYALDGIFSIKSDAFSFGVLVLEIVSGNKNRGFIHPENDNNLIGHAWSLYNEGKSMELIDANLADSCNPPEVLRSIGVGLLCVQQHAGDRPNMSSVVQMLSGEGTLPQPKEPAFFMNKEFLVADFTSSTYQAGSVSDLTITDLDAR
ncbi:S-locus glycoprotein domain-containing protein [Artemisia annua]|uniref:Receptor-like serine/threonine-protein kinase n=1 Tax=Artemisia annua TaxID=35608 RepID=A0A2U1Q3Y3_ARTAN|nr:S-locus glycoprotein domain-containing protein [Artemisia annua]